MSDRTKYSCSIIEIIEKNEAMREINAKLQEAVTVIDTLQAEITPEITTDRLLQMKSIVEKSAKLVNTGSSVAWELRRATHYWTLCYEAVTADLDANSETWNDSQINAFAGWSVENLATLAEIAEASKEKIGEYGGIYETHILFLAHIDVLLHIRKCRQEIADENAITETQHT